MVSHEPRNGAALQNRQNYLTCLCFFPCQLQLWQNAICQYVAISISHFFFQLVNIQHSIKIRYVIHQRITIPLTLPPGLYNVAVSLANAIHHFHSSLQIFSVIPIRNLTWSYGVLVATNDTYSITGSVGEGSNVTYAVDYRDGTRYSFLRHNSSQSVVYNHTYSSAGLYNVSLRASNLFSDEVDYFSLIVQDYIKDVNLTTPVLPTK